MNALVDTTSCLGRLVHEHRFSSSFLQRLVVQLWLLHPMAATPFLDSSPWAVAITQFF